MNKNEALQEVQDLSKGITHDAAQLIKLLGTGAVQLPIKGTDNYVVIGTLSTIATILPKDATRAPVDLAKLTRFARDYEGHLNLCPGGNLVYFADVERLLAQQADDRWKLDAEKLADAIHDAAVKCGILGYGTSITGPDCLMLLNNLAEMAKSAQQADKASTAGAAQASADELLSLALQEAGELAQVGLAPKMNLTQMRTTFKRIINCVRAGLSEAELASRCRAQGGNTSDKSGSDLATKAASAAPVAQWVSVDERLPEKYQDVLVWPYPTDDCMTAELFGESASGRPVWKYSEYTHGWGYESVEITRLVTHWMPLPAAPALQAQRDNDSKGGVDHA